MQVRHSVISAHTCRKHGREPSGQFGPSTRATAVNYCKKYLYHMRSSITIVSNNSAATWDRESVPMMLECWNLGKLENAHGRQACFDGKIQGGHSPPTVSANQQDPDQLSRVAYSLHFLFPPPPFRFVSSSLFFSSASSFSFILATRSSLLL